LEHRAGIVERGPVASTDGHSCPELRQAYGDGTPDAAAAAGDQSGFARKCLARQRICGAVGIRFAYP
jgi:hypothetical protein